MKSCNTVLSLWEIIIPSLLKAIELVTAEKIKDNSFAKNS